MRRILAAVAALLAIAPIVAIAQSQSWYRVAGNSNQANYVDAASIRNIGGKTIVVTKAIYKEQLNGDSGIFGAEIRAEYDCPDKSFRSLEYTYFDQAGKKLRTLPSSTINERKVPAPGSINEAMMDFVCYRKGGTLVADPVADAPGQIAKM